MSTTTTRRLTGAIGLLLAATALSGCAAMFGRAPAGAEAMAPAGTNQPSPSDGSRHAETGTPPSAADCLNSVSTDTGYDAPRTLNDFHLLNAGAVVGKFGSVGKAHWNTAGQERPLDVVGSSAVPVRPLAASEKEVVAGHPDPSHMVLVGGTVGCDTLSLASVDSIDLMPGQKYVFVVFEIDGPSGKPSGDWSLLAAWPMNNGIVSTTADGELTVGAIKQALNDGVPESTPPAIEEPSGPG